MKKMMMTLMAAMLISATAIAENKEKCNCQGKDKKPDKTEMVKHRTDETVKRYQLNDKQAKQLLDLNNKYADKMGPHGGPHRHGSHGAPGRGPKVDDNGQRPEPPKDMKRPERPNDEQRAEHRKQMEETMKAYDAELQKIMTPDQFKAYKADMQKRRDHHHPKGAPAEPQK